MKRKFVFVAVGDAEHIRTLNFSLPFLRHFTQKEIVVVTDLSRNEIEIEHDNVIEISVPKNLNNKEAAIFLKTGLFEIIEPDCLFCYLDTDVIAVRNSVDKIFNHFVEPITFCTDISRMPRFSPYAVHCERTDMLRRDQQKIQKLVRSYSSIANKRIEGFAKDYKKLLKLKRDFRKTLSSERGKFLQLRRRFIPLEHSGLSIFVKYCLLAQHLGNLERKHFFGRWARVGFTLVRPLLTVLRATCSLLLILFERKGRKWFAGKRQVLDEEHVLFKHFMNNDFLLNPFNHTWFDKEGVQLEHHFSQFVALASTHGFRYESEKRRWFDREGHFLFEEDFVATKIQEKTGYILDRSTGTWSKGDLEIGEHIESDRLRECIDETFGVKVEEQNWQHWNGGVFLFSEKSCDFLKTWHLRCREIFNDPRWHTRDQGTLIATAWSSGLGEHPTFPMQYNFLADYYSDFIRYRGEFSFDLSGKQKDIQPSFLHIYHHFGDRSWNLWQDIEKLRQEITPSKRVASSSRSD